MADRSSSTSQPPGRRPRAQKPVEIQTDEVQASTILGRSASVYTESRAVTSQGSEQLAAAAERSDGKLTRYSITYPKKVEPRNRVPIAKAVAEKLFRESGSQVIADVVEERTKRQTVRKLNLYTARPATPADAGRNLSTVRQSWAQEASSKYPNTIKSKSSEELAKSSHALRKGAAAAAETRRSTAKSNGAAADRNR